MIGPRQENSEDKGGVVAIFKKQISEGKSIRIFGDGNQQRLFTHVTDVVEANIRAWGNPLSEGQIYNVANAEQVTINALAYKMMIEMNKKVDIIYDKPLVGDIYHFMIDNTKVREDLGIRFTPFNLAIKNI